MANPCCVLVLYCMRTGKGGGSAPTRVVPEALQVLLVGDVGIENGLDHAPIDASDTENLLGFRGGDEPVCTRIASHPRRLEPLVAHALAGGAVLQPPHPV